MQNKIIEVSELKSVHGRGQRVLGLDLGTKTIGLAISDDRLKLASARTTLHRKKFSLDAASLVEMIEADRICALVIGLPLNMDGSEGPRAQSTRAFARNLGAFTDLPIVLWDERLSTVAAEEAMLEADLSRKKRAEKIDSVAAAIILQGALDRLNAL